MRKSIKGARLSGLLVIVFLMGTVRPAAADGDVYLKNMTPETLFVFEKGPEGEIVLTTLPPWTRLTRLYTVENPSHITIVRDQNLDFLATLSQFRDGDDLRVTAVGFDLVETSTKEETISTRRGPYFITAVIDCTDEFAGVDICDPDDVFYGIELIPEPFNEHVPLTHTLPDRLNVLAYNIYGVINFPPLNEVPPIDVRWERLPELVARYDVVIWSEAFDNDQRDLLKSRLANYAFHYHTQVVDGSSPAPLCLLGCPEDGGVFISSKWPIVNEQQIVYDDCSGKDCLAAKGAMYAAIDKQGRSYHVFGTHTQAFSAQSVRQLQFQQLEQFINAQNIPPDELVIIGGDLNVDSINHREEYNEMLATLHAVEPPMADFGHDLTADSLTNDQACCEPHEPPANESLEYLDYVLYSADHRQPIESFNAAMIYKVADGAMGRAMWQEDVWGELSDHYPVYGFFVANGPPTAEAGGPYSFPEGAAHNTMSGSGSDPDNDPLTYRWDIDNNGTFEFAGQTGLFDASGLNGPDTRTVALQVCDPSGACDTDSATVNVVNVAPVARDDGYSTDEDTPLTVAAPGVLGNDDDPVDVLSAVADSGPSNGTLTLNADGSLAYAPDANFNGSDGFTYHANDGTDDSNVATVGITVNPVNDPPSADAGADAVVPCDPNTGSAAVTLAGSGSDVDGDGLTFTWTGPGGLTAVGASPTFNLPLSPLPYLFTLTVDDGNGGVATDEVSVTVIDDTAPAVAIIPPDGFAAWNNGDVTLAFTAVDACSGIASFKYTLEGAQTGSGDVTGPITITAEGTTTVTVTAWDNAGNGPSTAVLAVNIDRTPPEIKNQFNPETLSVDVLALDSLSGVSPGPLVPACEPIRWGGVDDDGRSRSNAQSCTYTGTDAAGNTVVVIEKIKRTGGRGSDDDEGSGEIRVEVVSLQYNDGEVIEVPPAADKKFEWSRAGDGRLRELRQNMRLGRGRDRQQVSAHYSSRTDTTRITSLTGDPKGVTAEGLVLLCMISSAGSLDIVVP